MVAPWPALEASLALSCHDQSQSVKSERPLWKRVMPEQGRRGILAEVQHRRVFRVAALYVVTAWVVLQVGDVIVEPLDLPAAAVTDCASLVPLAGCLRADQ